MAAGKVKCPVCGKTNDKETAVKVNRRYCCSDCVDAYRRELAKKATAESSGYTELVSTICKLYEIPKPTGMMLKQIKTFHDALDLTYDGMRATLVYAVNWSNPAVSLDASSGISFVPYKYDEARRFFEDIGAVANHLSTVDARKVFRQERVISINRQDLEQSRHKPMKHMDIASMTDEE